MREVLLGLAVLALVAGCSSGPLTPDQQALREERIVDRQIAKEQLKAYTRWCNAVGGIVLVDERFGGRRAEPQCISREAYRNAMNRR